MGLEYESDTGQCPRCNRSPITHPYTVHPLIDVHFIVMDSRGPILGSFGRQLVACQPKREFLAAHSEDSYAATDDPRSVTCPACKRTKEWQELAKLFPELGTNVPTGGMQITRDCC